VVEKTIENAEGRAGFLIGTNALNYWRTAWRCSIEGGTGVATQSVGAAIQTAICVARGYDTENFDSALEGTKKCTKPFEEIRFRGQSP